jgi:nitroreductase
MTLQKNLIEIPEEAKLVINNVKSRWSCRVFKDEPLPKQHLEILLDAANFAPSPKNCQPWEFIVLTGEPLHQFHESVDQWLNEKEYTQPEKDKLKKLLPDGNYYTSLPAELLKRQKKFIQNVSGQLEKFGVKLKDVYKNTFYCHYAPVVILVISESVKRDRHGLEIHQALAAAIQNILLVSHALGYGSCWIGDILRFGKKLNLHFDIDEMKEVVAAIAIGRPGISVTEVSERIKEEINTTETDLTMERVPKDSIEGKFKFLGF